MPRVSRYELIQICGADAVSQYQAGVEAVGCSWLQLLDT